MSTRLRDLVTASKLNWIKLFYLRAPYFASLSIWTVALIVKVFVHRTINSDPPFLTIALVFSSAFVATAGPLFLMAVLSTLVELYFFTWPFYTFEINDFNSLLGVIFYSIAQLSVALVLQRQCKLRNDYLNLRKSQSEWLSNLSHEIRNPILGLKEMHQRFVTELNANSVRPETPQVIGKLIQQLDDLVLRLLEVATLQTKSTQLKLETCDLNNELKAVVEIFSQRACQKKLRLFFDSDQLPESLFLDRSKLLQVLNNLLDNAVKYTKVGSIHFKVQCEIDSSLDHCKLHFHIRDTGVGIPDLHQAHIFDPFFRVPQFFNLATDRSNSPAENDVGGLGLGLSICKQIIETYGGEIGCNSTLGFGTGFWFAIPNVKIQNQSSFAKSHGEFDSDSEKQNRALMQPEVLVVEDDPILQKSMQRVFFPLNAIFVETTHQAYQLVLEKNFDLLLTDLQLPDGSGIDAAIWYREQCQNRETNCYCVGMSASESKLQKAIQQSIQKGASNPFDDVFVKPLDPKKWAEILERFHKHLRTRTTEKIDQGKNEMTRVFLLEREKRRMRIEESFAKKDWVSLGLISHMLRSSFLALNQSEAAQACADLEDACVSEDVEKISKSRNQILSFLDSQAQ